jgi:trigger factor
VKVTDKKEEDRQAILTIEVEATELEQSMESAYRRLVKKVDIPGFRVGKATREVLERHVGRDKLTEEALNDLLPRVTQEAIIQQEITAFARPTVEVTQNEPLVFTATVPLPPIVELGDYKSIRLKPQPVKVKASEVNAILEQLRHQKATYEPMERAVKLNDLVVFDIEASVDGKAFMGQKGAQYPVQADANYPAPGFSQELVGLKRDEDKEFKLTFPDGYGRKELAGKEALYKVKILEVKEEKLPPLDDEFATGMNPEFKTLADLKGRVSASLMERAETAAMQEFEDALIKEATKMSQVAYPSVLVDIEVERMINQQLKRLQYASRSPEEFQDRLSKTPVDTLRKEYRTGAEERVNWSLVLGQIALAQKIGVIDKEIDEHIEKLVKGAEDEAEGKQKLNTEESREQVRQVLLTAKIMDHLKEVAGGPAKKTKKKQKETK